jgi:hypothetical protein
VNNTLTPPRAEQRSRPLDIATVTEILFDCAVESFVLAFLVQIMGGVVVGIVSNIWQDMTPSLPPIVKVKPAAESESSTSWELTFFHAHRLAILFVIIFVGKSWPQLARYSSNQDHRNAAAIFRRISRRVSAEWFSLVVGNAFTAFVAVLVLKFTQGFSLTLIVWQAIAAVFHPTIEAIVRFVPGGGLIAAMVGWYNDNQFRFAFWLLYSAAICDDLGLPNYKSLARYLWRRYFGSGTPTIKPSPEP